MEKTITKIENLLSENNKQKDVLATVIDDSGKEYRVNKWHISGIEIPANSIVSLSSLGENMITALTLKLGAIKEALKSDSTDLQNKAIDQIMRDLVLGAYQDKLTVYKATLTQQSEGNRKAIHDLQKIRQSADTHLLNIIKAVRDINRPPVNVVVKQAERVNVGDQINQGDQQVNIAKNEQYPK